MEKYKITTLSQSEFDKTMQQYDLSDKNVEQQLSVALISIVCSPNINAGFMVEKHGEGDKHYFNENHSNVLNLDFDDVEKDVTLKDGLTYKSFSAQDAAKVIEFIEKNENKDFIIHCHAGISRSGAIAQFMRDYYPWVDREYFDTFVRYQILPNSKVFSELKKSYQRRFDI
jgi:protein tyrosine phosphatase